MRATQVCPEPGLLRLRGGAFVRQAGEPDFHLLPGERQVELPCGGAEPVDDVKALVGRLLAAEQQACGLVQKLSEPSSKLGDGAASGGEGGVSLWGTVPACGIHRDQPGDGQPGGGAVLQQAGHSGTVDRRSQASGENDAAELPSLPVSRRAQVQGHRCALAHVCEDARGDSQLCPRHG
jgi:hypothetical protein